MNARHWGFAVKGLFVFGLAVPVAWSANSGCVTGQLLGIYDAQFSNVNTQSILRSLHATPAPASTAAPSPKVGFAGNDNSLSGNLPALGRYYFDGAGNIIGVSTGKIAFNMALGK